jgi:UDP-N-acetylglucosamine acyltransferase
MIDSRAVVSGDAQIGNNVDIGPYAIIEPGTVVGDDCEIRSHAVIARGTIIGKGVKVHSHAVLGTEPQDLKFKDTPTTVVIGDHTVIREFATVNRGTEASGTTIVGKDCLIMTYCHVAHDCVIGNNVVMANATQLGGHVEIGDWVVLGGVTKVHQFCRVGDHSMVGADVKIVKDVSPFTLVGKNPPVVEGINKIGLKRRGFTNEEIIIIDRFYDTLLRKGLNTTDGLEQIKKTGDYSNRYVKQIIEFIESSKRGIHR